MNPLESLKKSSAKKRVDAVIVQQLTQGLSAEKIALTIAVGVCIAIIPIVGATTILSFAAAWALRLNQPIIQTINWSSYALQLLLIFPFIRLGEWIFRAPRLGLSLDQMVALVKARSVGSARGALDDLRPRRRRVAARDPLRRRRHVLRGPSAPAGAGAPAADRRREDGRRRRGLTPAVLSSHQRKLSAWSSRRRSSRRPRLSAATAGDALYCKREDVHELGAFKWRGALPTVQAYKENGASAVVTASTGNHGAAVAWSCQRAGSARDGLRSRGRVARQARIDRPSRRRGPSHRHGPRLRQGRGQALRRRVASSVLRGRRRADPVRRVRRHRRRDPGPARRRIPARSWSRSATAR